MRIAIDARAWNWTGIGRYIRALVREYARIQTHHTFILFVPREKKTLAQASEYTKQTNSKFEISPVSSSYYSLREQLLFPLSLTHVKADVFHFPHFNVPISFDRPYVVTIHDITRLYFPGQKQQGLVRQAAYEFVFAHAVRRAQQVICVSHNTADELVSLGMRSNAMPIVIHEGVDDVFLHPPSDKAKNELRALLKTNDPYVLVVGVWMSHKNIPRILQAIKKMRGKHPNLKIVLTGKYTDGYVDVRQLANALALDDTVVLPGFVPDSLMPALYTEASALIFASLYEGFGLPALEAAALGAPVVASSVSSLPEVMGDAAEYVNPESVPDIARGITHVLDDHAYASSLVQAGKQRVNRFTWQSCAKQTLDAYELLAS